MRRPAVSHQGDSPAWRAGEQDHRAIKRVTYPVLGFKSFEADQSALVGIELMHMLQHGQPAVGEEARGLAPAE